ncbi:MAG: M23 family metallopeptidase [Candidatus Aenigmarchaeota archaeon]|nr:M23 family metallopeptidase [Candidatus Aenigmarchaeota archaeon]
MSRRMKGAGTTIESIMIMIIILFFFAILLVILSKTTTKNVQLNTETLELSKLSNTFYLLNRSLYTTWYVSTVQTLFKAGFDGLGCGFDSAATRQGYWYEERNGNVKDERNIRFPVMLPEAVETGEPFFIETYDVNGASETRYARMTCRVGDGTAIFETPPSGCTAIEPGKVEKIFVETSAGSPGSHIVSSCSISKYTDSGCTDIVVKGEDTTINMPFESGEYLKQSPERKYTSDSWSASCVPNEALMSHFLNLTFSSYKDIRRAADTNGVRIYVGTDDPEKNSENNDIISEFFVGQDNIRNRVSHEVHLESVSSSINTNIVHDVSIETNFSGMADNARQAVGYLITLRDRMTRKTDGTGLVDIDGNLVYRDETFDAATLYQESVPEIDGNGAPVIDGSGNFVLAPGDSKSSYISRIKGVMNSQMPSAPNLDVSVKENAMSFEALPGESGLALHYNVDASFSEKSTKSKREIRIGLQKDASKTFGWQWPTDSRRITSCFDEARKGERGSGAHKGLDIGSGEPDDSSYEDAVYPSFPKASLPVPMKVSRTSNVCAVGDSICGGGYGNFVELEYDTGEGKLYFLYAHLESTGMNAGDEFDYDPASSPDTIVGMMGNTGRSSGKHLHFEVRDEGGNKLNPCNFIDCSETTLRTCGFSGTDEPVVVEEETDSGYYFYDDDANRFYKLPMQLRIGAEGYLPAIDCTLYQGSHVFLWEGQDIMACSGGKLYTCGAATNIQGLLDRQKIGPGQNIPEMIISCGA